MSDNSVVDAVSNEPSSVLALVQASRAAEGSRASFGGGGAFYEVGDTWGVVTSDTNSAVADVGGVRHDIQVADHASLLQVAVGDVSFGIFDSDEALLHFERERRAPCTRCPVLVKENSAHALTWPSSNL